MEYYASAPPVRVICVLGKLTRRISIDRWRKRSAAKRGGELAAALDELNECVPSHENVEQDVLAADLERGSTHLSTIYPPQSGVCFSAGTGIWILFPRYASSLAILKVK